MSVHLTIIVQSKKDWRHELPIGFSSSLLPTNSSHRPVRQATSGVEGG